MNIRTMIPWAVTGMLLALLVGAVMIVDSRADGMWGGAPGGPDEQNPGCWFDAGGWYQCEGSPVASPIPVSSMTPLPTEVLPTPTMTALEPIPTATEEIPTIFIDTLPSTGSGTTANNVQVARAHTGWHSGGFFCANGTLYRVEKYLHYVLLYDGSNTHTINPAARRYFPVSYCQ